MARATLSYLERGGWPQDRASRDKAVCFSRSRIVTKELGAVETRRGGLMAKCWLFMSTACECQEEGLLLPSDSFASQPCSGGLTAVACGTDSFLFRLLLQLRLPKQVKQHLRWCLQSLFSWAAISGIRRRRSMHVRTFCTCHREVQVCICVCMFVRCLFGLFLCTFARFCCSCTMYYYYCYASWQLMSSSVEARSGSDGFFVC